MTGVDTRARLHTNGRPAMGRPAHPSTVFGLACHHAAGCDGEIPSENLRRATRDRPPGSPNGHVQLPAPRAATAEAAGHHRDHPDEREHDRDDEQPVNREADTERDDRQYSQEYE